MGLNVAYSKYFQYRYKEVGHLWQGRFKSKIIQKDEYLLNCMGYVEQNPVRAKIVTTAEKYVWSSYRSRVFG